MINLLPIEKRKEVIALYKSRRLVAFGLLFIFVIFVSVVLLALFFTTFNIQKKGLLGFVAEKDNDGQAKEFDRLSEVIKDLNQKSVTIVRANNLIKPSQVFDNIFKTKPATINILSIDFDQETNLVIVEGVADNRSALVSFVESLSANQFFSQVDSPISNLVGNENALFKIELTIKKIDNEKS